MLGVHLFFSIFVHLAYVAFIFIFLNELYFAFVGSIFVHICKMDKDGEKKMDNKHYSVPFIGFSHDNSSVGFCVSGKISYQYNITSLISWDLIPSLKAILVDSAVIY
jgi:hypothetical protein